MVAETCPQYLFLRCADLDRPAVDAARFVFSPPPRSPRSPEHLWQALIDGGIDLWSSDHSPYFFADKIGKAETPGSNTTLSGIPGIETRLPLLFSEGLLTGRLTLGSLSRSHLAQCRNGLWACARQGQRSPLASMPTWPVGSHGTLDARPCRPAFARRLHAVRGPGVTGKPATVLVRGVPVIADGVLRVQPVSDISCHAPPPIRPDRENLSRRRPHG